MSILGNTSMQSASLIFRETGRHFDTKFTLQVCYKMSAPDRPWTLPRLKMSLSYSAYQNILPQHEPYACVAMLFILIFGELTWTFFDDPVHKIFSSLLIYMLCFTFLNCSNVPNSNSFNNCCKVHVIIDGLERPLTGCKLKLIEYIIWHFSRLSWTVKPLTRFLVNESIQFRSWKPQNDITALFLKYISWANWERTSYCQKWLFLKSLLENVIYT